LFFGRGVEKAAMFSRKEIINAINNCLNENDQKIISDRFGVSQEKSYIERD